MATTNHGVVERLGTDIIRIVVQRLYILLHLERFVDLEGDCAEVAAKLVQVGACDPVKLFVKMEPHNALKRSQRRFRLISCVSFADQLVERILCGRQNKLEISMWDSIPSKPGMGLDDASIKSIWSQVLPHLEQGDVVSADISGFDFGMTDWEQYADATCRIRLAGVSESHPFAIALRRRVFCLTRSVYLLSDGYMYAQQYPGIQLSGSYNTSSTNSRVRLMEAYLSGAKWAIAMGDDSLEGQGNPTRYKELGKTLKMYEKHEDTFEFCSHLFKGGVAYPVDPWKTLFRLLNQNPMLLDNEQMRDGLVSQFYYNMRHSPELDLMREAVVLAGLDGQQNKHE